MRHTSFCNYALYQLGWFSCVLSAAAQHPWIGFLVAVILIGVHLTLSLERSLDDEHQRDFHEEDTEAAHPTLELCLRGAHPQTLRYAPELGTPTCLDNESAPAAADDMRAHEATPLVSPSGDESRRPNKSPCGTLQNGAVIAVRGLRPQAERTRR